MNLFNKAGIIFSSKSPTLLDVIDHLDHETVLNFRIFHQISFNSKKERSEEKEGEYKINS